MQTQPQHDLVLLVKQALEKQGDGLLDDAEKLFQQALKTSPNNPDILTMLGMLYFQQENFNKTLSTLKKISSQAQNTPSAQRLFVRCYLAQDKVQDAMRSLLKLQKLDPNNAQTFGLCGLCHYKNAEFDAAISYLEQSLKIEDNIEFAARLGELYISQINPQKTIALLMPYFEEDKISIHGRLVLGEALLNSGNTKDIYKIVAPIVPDEPNNDRAINLIAMHYRSNLMRNLREIDKEILLICFAYKSTPYSFFTSVTRQHFYDEFKKAGLASFLTFQSYDDFSKLGDFDVMMKTLDDPLLLETLSKTLISLRETEGFITNLRRRLLDMACEDLSLLHNHANTLFALASQYDLNEHVAFVSEEEKAQFSGFKDSILQHISEKSNHDKAIIAALIGLYEQIYDHDAFKNIKIDNAYFDYFFLRSYKDWRRIKKIQKNIKTSQKIKEDVSLKVQAQYEENPYPRWVGAGILPMSHLLYAHHSHQVQKDILIAGCGTGQQVTHARSRSPKARITAIDLSTASLAYAQFKIKELGYQNIDFYHCDILDLKALSQNINRRSFDYIECTGVLHHMKDPMAGWRVLTDLLKPGGKMKIGLYSQSARDHIVSGRDFISEKQYSDTPDDIRACRQDILNADPNSNIYRLVKSPDFYSLSTCRDLIFHVQEHRFTLPMIKAALRDLGLEFVHFSFIDDSIKNDFRTMHGDDADRRDLDLWDAFEDKHPETFVGMYQFFVKKPVLN